MKQYLFPALLALALHSLLFTVHLPSRQVKVERPAAIPVEIAIRQLEVKALGTKKKAAARPLPLPAPERPHRQPLPKKKPVQPVRIPPKKVVDKKRTAKKKTALTQRPKESKIEREKEKPATAPAQSTPEKESPVTSPSQPLATAGESREEGPANLGTAFLPATPGKATGHREAIPAYQQNRQPEYPPMARRRGMSGTVLLKVLVDTEGRVADLAVERSSGHGLLDRAALQAVRQWLFSPATDDGVPVAMWVTVPITFRLQE